jgi:hypothetical protein
MRSTHYTGKHDEQLLTGRGTFSKKLIMAITTTTFFKVKNGNNNSHHKTKYQ